MKGYVFTISIPRKDRNGKRIALSSSVNADPRAGSGPHFYMAEEGTIRFNDERAATENDRFVTNQ